MRVRIGAQDVGQCHRVQIVAFVSRHRVRLSGRRAQTPLRTQPERLAVDSLRPRRRRIRLCSWTFRPGTAAGRVLSSRREWRVVFDGVAGQRRRRLSVRDRRELPVEANRPRLSRSYVYMYVRRFSIGVPRCSRPATGQTRDRTERSAPPPDETPELHARRESTHKLRRRAQFLGRSKRATPY